MTISNNISVIDTASNTVTHDQYYEPVIRRRLKPGRYAGLCHQQLHVLGSNTVSVIDTATNTVSTIIVGDGAAEVVFSPDGARAYVTNFFGNSVSVIDTATNAVTTPIPVGSGPVGVAVGPDGTRAYVVNSASNDRLGHRHRNQ